MKFIKKFLVVSVALITIFSIKTVNANAENTFSSSAKSTYLIDYDSGSVIFAQNEEKRLPIASMTKIMLLNILFERVESGDLSLQDDIVVSENASGMGGSQVFLQSGGSYKLNDLVKSVVVASANDASVAIAEKICGSEGEFVNIMNQKAKEWGLNNTLFSNCTGLPKPTQYSCAKDVSKMLEKLISHEDYFKYSNIWLDEITHPDGSKTVLTNTNKLSKFYDGCDGGKTGFTSESLFCLSATAKRDNTRLICVVIGEETSEKRFKDVSDMFNLAFSLYGSTLAVDCTEPVCKAFIKGSYLEYANCYSAKNLSIFGKKNEKFDYQIETYLDENLKAPLKKGDTVGEILLFKDGVEYSRASLILKENVDRQSFEQSFDKIAENW